MRIDFYGNHLETLTELQALAKKHDCVIKFGADFTDFDSCETERFECPETVKQEIEDNGKITVERGSESNIYFELYEKNAGKYGKSHVLNYHTIDALVHCDIYDIDEVSKETKEWLENNMCEWSDNIDDCYIDTQWINEEVHGFENIKKEGCCYRTGMILAVFAQLVCDYLKEPRISRVYD